MLYRNTYLLTRLSIIAWLWFSVISLSAQVDGYKGTASNDSIPEKPSPAKFINDYTNTLTSGQKQILEQDLKTYYDTTSTQIVVVIVNSVQPFAIDDYGIRLFRKWGIGQKEKNNGILLLVALKDRKSDIETGYGADKFITTTDSKRILENIVKPAFRQEQYFEGVSGAISRFKELMSGGFESDETDEEFPIWAVLLIIIGLIIFFYILSRNKKYYRYYGNEWERGSRTPWSGGGGWSSSGGGWSSGGGGGWSSGGGGGWDFGGGSAGGGGVSGDW